MQNQDEKLLNDFRWAIDIVRDEFQAGLESICDEKFLKERYKEFTRKDDPVYVKLLEGMKDESLSKTLVSYWTIAQTLATQSRFWLENAIFKIIMHQMKNFGRNVELIYTQMMLSHGFFENRVSVCQMGEEEIENIKGRRPWRVKVHSLALQAIDLLVGQQERERVNLIEGQRARSWKTPYGDVMARDRDHLAEVASAAHGSSLSDVTLQCNMLVIEPDVQDGKPHTWAIRFINPKAISSHAIRKQERINLLRLYAFLVKEKLNRDPEGIEVCVGEYVPRKTEYDSWDRYPDYFSSRTYWSSETLWGFIGVPFAVVTLALQEAAGHFRERLTNGLRGLLPSDTNRTL